MSQVIKIEPIIDQSKELKKLFEDVNGKLCKLKYAVKLLESMLFSIKSSQDLLNCCKGFLTIQNSIGESIHSIQSYSIVSSRVYGLEIGFWRITLPHPLRKWVNFTFFQKKKAALDGMLQELENIFDGIVLLQNFLINLNLKQKDERFSVQLDQNQINLIDLPNQSKSWNSCDDDENEIKMDVKRKKLLNKLTVAKEWNEDSLLILRNLIEWDYRHRFSVGETNNDDEHDAEDENNDELTSVFVESYEDESHISYRKNTIPFHNVANTKRNPRTKRMLFFTLFFVGILLMCVVVLR